MRVLKHENGFIKLDAIGSMNIADNWGGKARVMVKVDGENVALFAPNKDSLKRRINAVADIITTASNKGKTIVIWEEL